MNISFICTGNTCRSPMAEGLMRKLLQDAGRTDITVRSAGAAAFPGDCASENAILAAAKLGADISAHRSSRLSAQLLDTTDLAVCMTAQHQAAVLQYAPNAKTTVLGGGIPDPYGQDLDAYRACAAAILRGVEALYHEINEKDDAQ